ncbi:MAG: hypothetical protein CR988_04695 [Treponema sp.]|nr:MAG: hypothetical protein CR988_04695 [Treponema sp.]
MVKNLFTRNKTARFYTVLLTAIVILFCYTSCSNNQTEMIKIFKAYQNYKHNKYDESLIDFMQVKKTAPKNEYAHFGIATVYLIKNMYQQSDEKLKPLEKSQSKLILANVYYQKGIIQFQNGNYLNAAEYFKKSIEHDKDAIDAKINYEICKNILRHPRPDKKTNDEKNSKKAENKTDEKILYDLVKEEEEKQWIKKQKSTKKNTANDY